MSVDYKITGKSVSKEEFEEFLSTLKEIPHTWYCAETTTGGITGYDAKDFWGIEYEYRCNSEPEKSLCTISRKM